MNKQASEFRSIMLVEGKNDLTEKVRRDFYVNLGRERRDIIMADDNN